MHENKVGYFFVGMLDILGQQNKILAMEERYSDFGINKDYKDDLVELYGAVKELRNSVKKTYKSYRASREEAFKENESKYSNSTLREIYKATLNGEIKIHSFSDLVLVVADLSDEANFGVFDILSALVSISAACISLPFHKSKTYSGIFIRGGIDVGRAGSFEPDDPPYGFVSVSAYRLECKFAKYPRIVIGNGLKSFLNALIQMDPEDAQGISEEIKKESHNPVGGFYRLIHDFCSESKIDEAKSAIKIARAVANECIDLIQLDADGIYFLDYLSPKLSRELGEPEKIFQENYSNIIKNLEEAYSKADKEQFEKYLYLKKYYEKNESNWIKDKLASKI